MATATPETNAKLPGGGRRMTDSMSSDFLSGFMRLDILRQLGLMVGLAASVAIGFAVVLWSRGEDYQPLYPDMNGYDMTQLVEALETRNLSYRIEPSTGVILVPADGVAELRLQMAAAGISRETGYGYESLDADPGLGTSQFMESNRYRRSQEGELQRTIMGFRNVQSARVHLATPERSVFVRSSRNTTASVFLTLHAGGELSDTQVDAIANLVASSVPDLSPENVTIVDQRGNLLSRKDDTSDLVIAGQQFDYARRYEDTLVERINRILQPVVGVGRYSAEVSADIDFTRTEMAAETFSPEGVLRSEQSLQESRAAADAAGGVPGALANNVPVDGVLLGADAVAAVDPLAPAASATGNTREQATRNFELDRTISYTNNDPVSVRRLSVAVVLDDRPAVAGVPAADGAADAAAASAQAQAWTPEELERITALVRDVVGFDASRGDSVTVIHNAFAPLVVEEVASQPFYQQDWLLSSLRQLAGVALVIALVFGVLRPVLRNLAGTNGPGKDLAIAAATGEYADLDINEKVTLSGGEDMLLSGPTDGYERQLNAIKSLIAQDPGRVAQVVKQWISEDA